MSSRSGVSNEPAIVVAASGMSAAERRIIEKDISRIERTLRKVDEEEATIHGKMAEAANDHALLGEMTATLKELAVKRDDLESAWMVAAESLN